MGDSTLHDTLEVEVRGPLPEEEYRRLHDFLSEHGTSLGVFNRFLIDYSTLIEGIAGRKKDIRVRITNGVPEIIVKVGEWAGEHRTEVSVQLKENEFPNALHLMALLGYKRGVACERVIRKFVYDDIEFALQEVPGHSRFYEAEQLAATSAEAGQAHARIMETIQALRLSTFSKEDWYAYVDTLNKEANSIFDFESHDANQLLQKGVKNLSTVEQVKRELQEDVTHESLLSAYSELKGSASDREAKKLLAEICYLIAQERLRLGDRIAAKTFAEESIAAYRDVGVQTIDDAAPILFKYVPDIMHEDVVRDRILSRVG